MFQRCDGGACCSCLPSSFQYDRIDSAGNALLQTNDAKAKRYCYKMNCYSIDMMRRNITWYNQALSVQWYQRKRVFRTLVSVALLVDVYLMCVGVAACFLVGVEWPLVELSGSLIAVVVSKSFYYPYCFLRHYYTSNYWNERTYFLWTLMPFCYVLLIVGLLDTWFFLSTRTSMWQHLLFSLFPALSTLDQQECLPIVSDPSHLPTAAVTASIGYAIFLSLILLFFIVFPLHMYLAFVHRRNTWSVLVGRLHNPLIEHLAQLRALANAGGNDDDDNRKAVEHMPNVYESSSSNAGDDDDNAEVQAQTSQQQQQHSRRRKQSKQRRGRAPPPVPRNPPPPMQGGQATWSSGIELEQMNSGGGGAPSYVPTAPEQLGTTNLNMSALEWVCETTFEPQQVVAMEIVTSDNEQEENQSLVTPRKHTIQYEVLPALNNMTMRQAVRHVQQANGGVRAQKKQVESSSSENDELPKTARSGSTMHDVPLTFREHEETK